MRHSLRAARTAKKLSQRELGKMVGLSFQSISLLELGRMDTSSANWLKLAEVLETPLEALIGPRRPEPE